MRLAIKNEKNVVVKLVKYMTEEEKLVKENCKKQAEKIAEMRGWKK